MSPFIYALKCDGPDCPREELCQFDPQRGVSPPSQGWKTYEGKPFCGALCLSRYTAQQAQEELSQLVDALHANGEGGAGSGLP
jgi:hypothetical protein